VSPYLVSKQGKWAEAWLGVIVDGRAATDEETKLMDKIVWQKDTSADRERLRELLTNRPQQ
jgi:hypothetical protein